MAARVSAAGRSRRGENGRPTNNNRREHRKPERRQANESKRPKSGQNMSGCSKGGRRVDADDRGEGGRRARE